MLSPMPEPPYKLGRLHGELCLVYDKDSRRHRRRQDDLRELRLSGSSFPQIGNCSRHIGVVD